MRTHTLFLVAGMLGLLFGLSFLLAPAAMLPVYGVSADAATVFVGRFFGAVLFQLGLTLYLVREVREPKAQRGLALASVIGSACGALVALMGVLNGTTNGLGWSTVVIYACLFLGFASCLRAGAAV